MVSGCRKQERFKTVSEISGITQEIGLVRAFKVGEGV